MRTIMLALAVGCVSVLSPSGTVQMAADNLREPFGVDFDAAGTMYVVEMAGHGVSVVDRDGQRRVLAGTGEKGFGGDGGPADRARFNGPHHLLVGPDGRLHIADTWNNSVRRIDLRTGIVERVAGTGRKGFSGDGGSALDADFGGIYAIAFRDTTLYACDLDNRRVRAIDLKTGIVTTVAGNGEKGVPVDGGDARSQPLVDPRAVAIDSAGNLYILERVAMRCASWIGPGRSARWPARANRASLEMADPPDRRCCAGRSTSPSIGTARCSSPTRRTTSSGATHRARARSSACSAPAPRGHVVWAGLPISAS